MTPWTEYLKNCCEIGDIRALNILLKKYNIDDPRYQTGKLFSSVKQDLIEINKDGFGVDFIVPDAFAICEKICWKFIEKNKEKK